MASSGPRSGLHRALCNGIVSGLRLLPKQTQSWVRQMFEPVGLLDYSKAEIKMLAGNSWQRMRLRSCAKEPETVKWLEAQLKPGDVLYDIGANVGAYSLLAAAIEKHTTVLAFEPSATTFGVLAQNIALNDFGSRIQPFCIALSDHSGVATFRHSDFAAGAACHEADPTTNSAFEQATVAMGLDEFIQTFKAPHPTLVKIDIDGAELALLAGAKRTLSDPSVRSVLLEITIISPEREAEIVDLIHGLGFKTASRDRRGNDKTYNWVFEREPVAVAR